MKSTIKANELTRALKLCVNATDPKDPVRSNIEFVAENDKITVAATNTQYYIRIECDSKVDEEGIAVVDGKMAYNVATKASGDCILSTNDNSMTIKTNGRTKLPNIDRRIPVLEHVEKNHVHCDAVAFKNAFSKVAYAISEDESRVILTGAHIVTNGNIMTFTALDGFRLTQTQIECGGESVDIVVPQRILSAICDSITDGELDIYTDGIHLSVNGDGFEINSVILSGQYIDTARIIPQSFNTNALVKTQDMRNLLNSATVASGASNLVKLIVSNDSITVTSNSEIADFNGECDALVEGEGLSIAFNLKYLAQAINHIDTEQCDICFTSPTSPCVLKCHNDVQNDFSLILPVRVFQ